MDIIEKIYFGTILFACVLVLGGIVYSEVDFYLSEPEPESLPTIDYLNQNLKPASSAYLNSDYITLTIHTDSDSILDSIVLVEAIFDDNTTVSLGNSDIYGDFDYMDWFGNINIPVMLCSFNVWASYPVQNINVSGFDIRSTNLNLTYEFDPTPDTIKLIQFDSMQYNYHVTLNNETGNSISSLTI